MSEVGSTVREVTDSSSHTPEIDLDASTASAWLAFTERLAGLIEQQGDRAIGVFSEEGTTTINRIRIDSDGKEVAVMLRGNAGLPQVLRLSRGSMSRARRLGWSRASSVSKHYTRFFSDRAASEVAREVATVLSEVIGVLHPAFLTLVDDLDPAANQRSHEPPTHATASDPTAIPASPAQPTTSPLASGVRPSGPRHLDQLVDQTLAAVLGRQIQRSECGEIDIEVGESTVYVEWSTSRLVVPLVTLLAAPVDDVAKALVVVNHLNQIHRGVTVVLEGRAVVARIDVPANPYDGELLIGQLSRLCDLVIDHRAAIARQLRANHDGAGDAFQV